MSAIAAAIATSAVVGAVSSRKAGKAQAAAADRSAEVQKEIFEKQTELAEPFRQAGISSQNELLRLLGIGGDQTAADYGMLTRQFGEQDMQMDPGYSQDLASQEYMNAFNRAQAQLGTRLGTLGSLYGAGQAAAQQVAGQAGQYGENVGNLLMAGGAARASGYAGMGNALNQALGQYINYTQGQDVLKYLRDK